MDPTQQQTDGGFWSNFGADVLADQAQIGIDYLNRQEAEALGNDSYPYYVPYPDSLVNYQKQVAPASRPASSSTSNLLLLAGVIFVVAKLVK